MPLQYDDSVFINCPFDDDYLPIFEAIVFVTYDAGFIPRSALEIKDSSVNRLEKILNLISDCKHSIHDISRTELDPVNLLPRFNMPLELGIFLGCKEFGSRKHKSKSCLILDRTKYRFQKFISDIAGQDIEAHNNSPKKAIIIVRDWLRVQSKRTNMPGGSTIYKRYSQFKRDLPLICEELRLEVSELHYVDFSHVVTEWLKSNPLKP
ncbi:MAG: hypothetical protein V3U74_04915 [Thermodesulfobacteriota bacterium]